MPANQNPLIAIEAEKVRHQLTQREKETASNISKLQSFFDLYQIDFDVELAIYLISITHRVISTGYLPPDLTAFPIEQLKEQLSEAKEAHHPHKLRQTYDAVGRLALTFFYFDIVLGPLLHSDKIQAVLFKITTANPSVPKEDIKLAQALLDCLCNRQASLKALIRQYCHEMALQDILPMVKEHIGTRSPLLKGMTTRVIKHHFLKKRTPEPIALNAHYALSVYANKRAHQGDVKYDFFGGHSQKEKLNTVKKVSAFWREEEMALKDCEVDAMLEKGSSLRLLMSNYFFSFPRKQTFPTFYQAYESFPMLDDPDHPHHISFLPC